MNIFNPTSIKDKEEKELLSKLNSLCKRGPDNFLYTNIGIEDVAKELLSKTTYDFIGFISYAHWNGTFTEHRLRITTIPEKVERAVIAPSANATAIAEKICKARNITPTYIGGDGEYLHISKGSYRTEAGYTMGFRL